MRKSIRVVMGGLLLFALAPSTLTASTIDELPGFRRCMLVTEQSFMRRRAELPAPLGCSFESALWELEHPWDQTRSASVESLSWPARAGAAFVKLVAPEHHSRLAELVQESDGLPANGRWAGRQSEFLDRILGPR
jgi:hypothetical protein